MNDLTLKDHKYNTVITDGGSGYQDLGLEVWGLFSVYI